MSRRYRIGVVRGGPSAEHEVSLETGASVLAAILGSLEERYEPIDVIIDKEGRWHIDGAEIAPEEAIHRFDFAWNALRGAYGENGKIQSFFESHGVKHSGSGSLASAIGMNKSLTKKILRDAGIKSPYWKELPSAEIREDASKAADALFTTFLFPAVIKPAQSGSSIGVSIVREKKDIAPALEEAARHGDTVLVEEYIPGIEATCGIIEGFRGQDLYALPPIEIRLQGGRSEEIVPARFAPETTKAVEDLARAVHRTLGLNDFSRTDFIIHPRRGIYVLETNTLPGMAQGSLIPKALRAVGSDIHELVDHIIRDELGV